MRRADLISEDPSVIAAGYKARGMTKEEIQQLLKIHPKENATKEQKENYLEMLSETTDKVLFRHDTRRAGCGIISGAIALSLLSIAKAAHTFSSPKTMYTCIGLSILAGLYSYSRFSRIGFPIKNEEKRIQKAKLKAFNKLQKENVKNR